jgi:hypothetical protein
MPLSDHTPLQHVCTDACTKSWWCIASQQAVSLAYLEFLEISSCLSAELALKKILQKDGQTAVTWRNRIFLIRKRVIYEADLSFVSQAFKSHVCVAVSSLQWPRCLPPSSKLSALPISSISTMFNGTTSSLKPCGTPRSWQRQRTSSAHTNSMLGGKIRALRLYRSELSWWDGKQTGRL